MAAAGGSRRVAYNCGSSDATAGAIIADRWGPRCAPARRRPRTPILAIIPLCFRPKRRVRIVSARCA